MTSRHRAWDNARSPSTDKVPGRCPPSLASHSSAASSSSPAASAQWPAERAKVRSSDGQRPTQQRNDLVSQQIAIETDIGIARIIDPCDARLLGIV